MLLASAALMLFLTLAATASGQWDIANNPDRLCGDLKLCTTNNYTWSNLSTVYDSDAACGLLARKGIKTLRMYGKRPPCQMAVVLAQWAWPQSTPITPSTSCKSITPGC